MRALLVVVLDIAPQRAIEMPPAEDEGLTVFEPNRRIEFETIAGPVRPHGRYDFEALDGGTRLTFSLDVQLAGLRKLLMGSAVQTTIDTEVRTLDNLKRVLEV